MWSKKIKHGAISIHNGLLGNSMFGKQCTWIQLGGKNQIIIQWKALDDAIGFQFGNRVFSLGKSKKYIDIAFARKFYA